MWKIFLELVARHFSFLETQFGFTRKSTILPNVIYKSEQLQMQVYYDLNGRHELDLGINRVSDDPRKRLSIGMGMLMRLKGGQYAPA
jgi:hypothetical protein